VRLSIASEIVQRVFTPEFLFPSQPHDPRNFWPTANKGYNFSAMESENCSSFRGIL